MTQNSNFENINSFSSNIKPLNDKTISFPAQKRPALSRVRFFIYFLILMIMSFLFLIIGYRLSSINYEMRNKNEPISNTNVITSVNQNSKQELTDIIEATVSISVFNNEYLSEATGVIISSNGYIVTNDHIYQDVKAPTLLVFDQKGNQYNAEYIGGDSKYDISVIKINADNLPFCQFDTVTELRKGDEIYSIGRQGSVTKGIVSEFVFETNGSSKSVKMIRTDCSVNPGDSGGPVAVDGKIVALNCSKTVALDVEGMSYLLPAKTVSKAVNQLIEHGKIIDRPVLGISYNYISPVYAIQNNCISGIRIDLINSNSDLYGKDFVNGDVIIAIDGMEINREEVMLDCLAGHSAGESVELTIRKINGTDRDVTVTLITDSSFSSYSSE